MSITNIKKQVGRPSTNIEYSDILYNNNEYIVGKIQVKDSFKYFVIDKEDFPKIKDYSWHYTSNAYISHNVNVDGEQKALYLHNMVLSRIVFPGKGAKETVDHINRIGLDNRKENLRVITQSEQNLNQSKRSRKVELPEDSQLTADNIPKHIWYVKANGNHGDRFAIELKTENITWKTTSSKNVLLKDKLKIAKDKLQEYYIKYPYLNPNNEEMYNKIKELSDSYNEIIKLTNITKEIKEINKSEINNSPKQTLSRKRPIVAPYNDIKIENDTNVETDSNNTNTIIIPQVTEIPSLEEKIKIIQNLTGYEKKEIKDIVQWKVKQIYEAIATDSENTYKEYCEQNNDISKIPTWESDWVSFVLSVKGKTQKDSEQIIRNFVENLRRIRHNELCYEKNSSLVDRKDREQWPAKTIVRAFLDDKLDKFKEFTEKQTDDNPDDTVWQKRWNSFVKSLEENKDNETKLKELCSKFLTAQRAKRYRHNKS